MLKQPTVETLTKYGMILVDWTRLAVSQGGVCRICQKLPQSGRLCIDHEHVKGYSKMTSQEKISHVRGLLCMYCNRYRVAKNTRQTIGAVADYLTRG